MRTHEALLRHFRDLRDGTHGHASSREDKERLFTETVALMDAVARQTLDEVNTELLLGTGQIQATGLTRGQDGGLMAAWSLTWPEQRRAGVEPVALVAHYGRGFQHPHLRGGTVGEWPLNVFNASDAADQLPTLRAIAAADVHNLVFQADYRLIPAVAEEAPPGGR
ncbi:hypothetical protein ABT294_01630 [Nonomuraea sp. NPDC000554]|uniref:hypothetical protein n=1 Tax=Nonomuraea sp. NPDC000554 TaxID=3154259 RepID=UPI00331A48F1